MIIRSQDRKSIFNLESIKSIKAGVLFKSWDGESCDISIDTEVVGTYSTEEKAIKVLDMIEKQYASYSCRYRRDCSSYAVFQMPQDSEV